MSSYFSSAQNFVTSFQTTGDAGAQFLVGGVRIADEEVRGMQGERGGQQASIDIIVGHLEPKCLMLTGLLVADIAVNTP